MEDIPIAPQTGWYAGGLTAREFLKQHRSVIVLAGSRHAADDLVRDSCDSALLGVARYTLRDLVLALSSDRMNAAGLAPISGVARDALAAAVARRAPLRVLREASGFPGFAGALSRTLRDLRLARVSPPDGDLALLLDGYEAELLARAFADYPARVELAIEEARTMTPAAVVLLDVVARSTAEKELVRALVDRAPAVLELPIGSDFEETCLGAVKQFALSGTPAPQRGADQTFGFVSASSESLECVEVARQIQQGGVPFDECAVLLRNPHRHGPLIREAFDRAGIPGWYSQGSRRADIAGRSFLLLLKCREERFSAKRFAEFLSLGKRHPAWERLIREAGVIGGASRWKSRLDLLTEDYGLRDFALPVIEMLAALPRQALWREWLAQLEELAELALPNPRSVLDLLDELAPLGDLGPVTTTEVMHLLERSLVDFREPEEGSRYGKVFVAPIEEARGMRFRAVYVPGLNEGMFPRPPREDPLLLDEQREALGMPLSQDDGELLHIAVACASERLAVSCALLDLATGRARVPSFFAAEVLKAAYGSEADLRKLLEEARNKSETRIGWSAPALPEDSIDEAEYDLSAFRAAVKAKTKGGYAWITSLNKHAERAIKARVRRWSEPWSSADGLADTDVHVSGMLAESRLQKRAYSVSALQQFARCPYRFYLSQIVKLTPMEEPDVLERMDALVRGRLYHKVLFHLFSGGGDLDSLLRQFSDELALEHAPPVAGVWATEVEKLRVDLLGWLAIRDPEWKPLHVELSFGLPDTTEHDAASVLEPVTVEGGYRLKGSIDLVERHSADGRLRVLDHKTGKFPFQLRNCIVGGGEVLQPVLYSLAVEAILGQAPGLAVLSYATLRGGYQTIPVRIDLEARQRATKVLSTIDGWIDHAFLPAAPKKDGCKGCEYLPVCGPYEELRVTEKSQSELRGLIEIRRLS